MPNTPDTEAELVKLERIAHRMEQALRIPGTEFRFGLDAILGLVPGIGDALTLAPSLYILLQARKLGASTPLLGRMGANLAIDAIIGTIPLIGDIFDIGWKANTRNVQLLRASLARKGEAQAEPVALQA